MRNFKVWEEKKKNKRTKWSVIQTVKKLPAIQETQVQSLGGEDALEKGMATHSWILSWRIPWTEEPGRLQSRGSQRVGQDWATNTFTSLSSSLEQRSLTGGVEGNVGLDLYLVWWLEMCLLKPSLKWMPWLSKHKSGTCIYGKKSQQSRLTLQYHQYTVKYTLRSQAERGWAFRWRAWRKEAIKTNITFALSFVGRFMKG